MTIYYVYQYVREDLSPYYIGKGSKRRAWAKHKRANGANLRPRDFSRIQIIKDNLTEEEAWDLETTLIKQYGKIVDGGALVNCNDGGEGGRVIKIGSRIGKKNPMYGKNNPCSEQKRLDIIKTKNQKNYKKYQEAILLMNNGASVNKVSKDLGIGRGVCFRLKNRSHMFFLAFPELK